MLNAFAFDLVAMFYDGIGNEIGAEMALAEANRLNVHAAAELAKTVREEERQREEQMTKERESADLKAPPSPEAPGTEVKSMNKILLFTLAYIYIPHLWLVDYIKNYFSMFYFIKAFVNIQLYVTAIIKPVLCALDASADPGGPAIKQTAATPTNSVAGSDSKSKKNAAVTERKGSAVQPRKSGRP